MQLSQHPDCVTKPLRGKTHGHKEGERNMQIRIIISGACCLAMLAVTGIAHAASLSNTDQQFMIMAAKADMTEAHEGQMAEHQARGAHVKDFANTLVQDHTESYEHLTELAAKTGFRFRRESTLVKSGPFNSWSTWRATASTACLSKKKSWPTARRLSPSSAKPRTGRMPM